MNTAKVIVVAGLLACTSASAQTVTSASGITLPKPSISNLDCAKMVSLLRQYSASGYRRDIVPAGHPDHAIFLYENKLAEKYYLSCQAQSSKYESPGKAFSDGFD